MARRTLAPASVTVAAAFTGGKGVANAWDGEPIELLHPRTGAPAPFLVLAGRLCEANLFRAAHAAWFAGERVLADGGLALVTPVDPLFPALPLLEAARRQTADAPAGVFCDAEQALHCERCPHAACLAALLGAGAHEPASEGPQEPASGEAQELASGGLQEPQAQRSQLEAVCETRDVAGERFYRVDDARVLAWLRCKVARAAAALRGSGGAFGGMDDAGLAAYAAGLLGEWLSPAWQRKLAAAYGLPASGGDAKALQPLNRMPPDIANERPEKRPKVDPKEHARRVAAEAKAEAKKAQLARESSGMRSISSFFGAPKGRPK
ncbi:hypothetical protein WJX81_004454 [Elliptochloris bilobata]|uniref:Ribonuclease H2 subunit B wHTH domain-containing protein n=1 Tax=Elliptochloris bilobata TaxID=381761 RepID=A0AAW1R277_9CHLO